MMSPASSKKEYGESWRVAGELVADVFNGRDVDIIYSGESCSR